MKCYFHTSFLCVRFLCIISTMSIDISSCITIKDFFMNLVYIKRLTSCV